MTRFIPNFSTQQLLPPWVSLGARNWVFAIKVPHHCLQGYLDTHFNCAAPDRAPFYYEALDYPFGLLRVTKHSHFSSHYGGSESELTLSKIDVNWSYPVHRWRVSDENIRYDRQTVWVEPMAFDNNSYTMFSSREIWGTESDMARIVVDEESHPDRMHIDVAMQGLRRFTPKSKAHLIGVLHMQMNPEVKSDLLVELEKYKGLAGFVGTVFSSVGFEGSPEFHRNSEVNTLKQFRDVFNMQIAVYRALIASRTDQTNVSDLEFYEGRKVILDFMWSETMAEPLEKLFGITLEHPDKFPWGHPGKSAKIDNQEIDWNLPRIRKKVVLAASFTSDIRYDVTGTLHTYGGH